MTRYSDSMTSATKTTSTYWDSNVVDEFVAGSSDVLVLNRSPNIDLAEAVEAGRFHEFLAPINRQTLGYEIRSGLREMRLKSTGLANDLVGLANSFLDQFEIDEAKLRIEITRSQPCPNFHYDNLNVRMVTTYLGPTTEYQAVGEDAIQTAPICGLVFLKGLQHPTYQNTVHHRSPSVPDGVRRLCVAIDY